MRHFRTLTALLAVAATLSCTDLPLDENGGSGGDFDIGVGGGTAPNYSWSGGTAFEVSVVRTSNQTVLVWGVASTAQNMSSPVRHGSVPGGAIELANRERTLAPGTEYRVTVKLANGDQAFRDFRP
jgi:hypothetical protein